MLRCGQKYYLHLLIDCNITAAAVLSPNADIWLCLWCLSVYSVVISCAWGNVCITLCRLASSSWTCTATWYLCMTWSHWRRSLTHTWTSTCGTRRTRDDCFHRGSNQLMLSLRRCWRTSGARVRAVITYYTRGFCSADMVLLVTLHWGYL